MARSLPTLQTIEKQKGRKHVALDNHEFVIRLNDDESGLKAFVAVHSTALGPALGGTRMLPYKSEDDAVRDALNLSRAMSYKCALANLPYGGGKGVIMIEDKSNKDEVFLAYGRLIEKLRGLFKTGTDVGVTDDDVKKMASQTQHMLGVTVADRGDLTTAKVAALGVFYAMRAALRHMYDTPDFSGRKIAIKGVGKLGGELARLVSEAGGEVFVADTHAAACEAISHLAGLTVVPVEDIQKLEVDIYAPCALGDEFTEHDVQDLHCKAIVGGANNQLATPHVGDLIAERDILYAPDYVANAGGLIYVADELEMDGFNKDRVLARTRMIEDTMADIFERAHTQRDTPGRVADLIAEERMDRGLRV